MGLHGLGAAAPPLGGLILLGFAYAAGSVSRNRVWKDSLSLWSDTARKAPESAVAQDYLCFAQYDAGRPQDALQSCRRALELDEGRIDARINLAIASYRNALRANPYYAEAHNNLGVALAMTGRREEAITEISAAVRLAPDNREYASSLAAGKAGPAPPLSTGQGAPSIAPSR
jgi:tetratricopeptide (TPR) repeat protein